MIAFGAEGHTPHAGGVALVPGFGLAGTSDQIDLVRKGLEEKNWQGTYQADRMHYLIGVAKNQNISTLDSRSRMSR